MELRGDQYRYDLWVGRDHRYRSAEFTTTTVVNYFIDYGPTLRQQVLYRSYDIH